jgi:hypothetical protein
MAEAPDPNEPPAAAESALLKVYARGVSYPGEEPGTTEFSGALFDAHGRPLARHVHAVLPFAFEPATRGRPPKDVRDALSLLAAFDLHTCQQQKDGNKIKKSLAYASLGYADDRAARAALGAAREKLDRLLPDHNWKMFYLPNDPMPFKRDADLPELGERGLWGVWFAGDGTPPEIGGQWRGHAVAVFVPVGFEPRKERAAVRMVSAMNW